MQLIELLEREHQDYKGERRLSRTRRLSPSGAYRVNPTMEEEESKPVGRDSYRNLATAATPVVVFEPPPATEVVEHIGAE